MHKSISVHGSDTAGMLHTPLERMSRCSTSSTASSTHSHGQPAQSSTASARASSTHDSQHGSGSNASSAEPPDAHAYPTDHHTPSLCSDEIAALLHSMSVRGGTEVSELLSGMSGASSCPSLRSFIPLYGARPSECLSLSSNCSASTPTADTHMHS